MAYPCTNSYTVDWEVLQTRTKIRCRRCENCMKARRHQWMVRAAREQVHAKATWFVTLTYGPLSRQKILETASELPRSHSQQTRLVLASGWYVSSYIKRLRSADFGFRYLMVPEPHRDGFPHYHGLIHDQLGTLGRKMVLKKDKRTGERRPVFVCPEIEEVFGYGFVDSELVRDKGAIAYVTKYIAKGRFGRIRASRGYGGEHLLLPEMRDQRSVLRSLAQEVSRRLGEKERSDVSLRRE